jgi:hypothetical protein
MKITNKQNGKVQPVEFQVCTFGKTKIIAAEPLKEAAPGCVIQMNIAITDGGNVSHFDLLLTPSEAAFLRKIIN